MSTGSDRRSALRRSRPGAAASSVASSACPSGCRPPSQCHDRPSCAGKTRRRPTSARGRGHERPRLRGSRRRFGSEPPDRWRVCTWRRTSSLASRWEHLRRRYVPPTSVEFASSTRTEPGTRGIGHGGLPPPWLSIAPTPRCDANARPWCSSADRRLAERARRRGRGVGIRTTPDQLSPPSWAPLQRRSLRRW